MSLRVLVHLCPAVPTAPNNAPRTAISRSACSLIMIALFPPSSNRDLPRREATTDASAFPIRVDPVADTSGMRGSALIHSPASRPPVTIQLTPSGTSFVLKIFDTICWHAREQSGVFSEPFHTDTLPQTHASILFQLHTATGKLNAEIIPTIPSGCHCSYIRCWGLSLCIVNPYSCRDKPTAKSQISIISCTSPNPSCRLFPIS